MDLFLVAPELDLTVELVIPPELSDSVRHFLAAVEGGCDHEEFCERLGRELGKILPELIDWKSKPPTKAQLAFAQSLCRKFGLSLPEQTRQSRGAMHQFLEVHAARLQK